MTELEESLTLAERLLDEPNADPDDDLRMLARQFLRARERDKIHADTFTALKVYTESCVDSGLRHLVTQALDNLPWLLEDHRRFVDHTECLQQSLEKQAKLEEEIIKLKAKIAKLEAKPPKWFPIQQSTPIPWALVQRAYDTYAKFYGTSQSLERLAKRGGFGLQEFACLFHGHRPLEGCPDNNPNECVEQADAVGRELAKLEKVNAELHKRLQEEVNWEGKAQEDLIHANRDQMLKMYEEAVQRIKSVLSKGKVSVFAEVDTSLSIISALNTFHPMNDSWQGWPEGSKP